MTRRRELEEHRHKLDEIHGIMSSMKTLAYMETRKLSRVLGAQQAVLEDIEEMAADFISFFPETITTARDATDVYILLGSERGFCGDFNTTLLPTMESCVTKGSINKPLLIAIGHKLHTTLETDTRVIAHIDGANVMEEVETVLARIIETLVTLQSTHPILSLFALYHSDGHSNKQSGDEQQVLMQKLLPPFQRYLGKEPDFSHAPILNVAPADFLLELTDHYLLAALHDILYTSLMAENHRRVQHLEGAVQHLDEKATKLASKCNTLRQEEIIEEIEVILLSAENLM